MQSEEIVSQPTDSSNIIAIGTHRKIRHRKFLEQMLLDIPEDKREDYRQSDVMRIMLAGLSTLIYTIFIRI